MKKIVFSIIVLALIGGGFFYWWQGHADERELNKTLPEGVRVDKCLLSGEYRVINEIDGYEFKIPPEWQGINEIAYVPERVEKGYILTGIELEGQEGVGRIVVINQFKTDISDLNLEDWAKVNFETFGLISDFNKEMVENFEVVKTREFIMPIGYVYFFKNNFTIYAIACGSEEFIRYIITHGKW